MSNRDFEPGSGHIVWLNGELVPAREAMLSPLDRGFLYGDGLFETMRAQEGTVLFLKEHVHRLHEGLEKLRITTSGSEVAAIPSDAVHWRPLLSELLTRNDLDHGCASVKIAVSRGIRPGLGLPPAGRPTVLVSATPYEPPTTLRYREGWSLHVVSGVSSHSLVRYKTLNYLFFLMARQEALDAGFDEALILDSSGSVAETAAGSLLVRTAGGWVRPESPYQLTGITVRTVARMLERKGTAVAVEPLALEGLFASRAIWVLNSLMGIMPVSAVDGHAIPDREAGLAERLRRQLFAGSAIE